ncbi:MAG: hypothetical protein M1825_000649 [Sarcosagium campestre]|nr:MAG: hypothetical protein M1825_000649 [Sarcosagium campestre]
MSTTPPQPPPASSDDGPHAPSIGASPVSSGLKRTREGIPKALPAKPLPDVFDAPPEPEHLQNENQLDSPEFHGDENSVADRISLGLKDFVPDDTTNLEDAVKLEADLEPFDWEQFEVTFQEAIKEQDVAQKEIFEEFRDMSRFFGVWAQTAMYHETERAQKRIKTRIYCVRRDEVQLAERRDHYVNVVGAFQNALALLSNT